MAHRALSTQPALGGPIYFIRNIVYNAPEGGALKLTANSAGVLVYNNTLLSEAHQMGPASNLHFRNNLILGAGRLARSLLRRNVHAVVDFGLQRILPPRPPGPSLFAWAAPAGAAADYDARAARPVQSFPTLKTYSERTGQDSHSRMVDWSIFRKASPPVTGRPHAPVSPGRLRFQPCGRLRSRRCRHGSARRHRWLHRQGAGSGRARNPAGRSRPTARGRSPSNPDSQWHAGVSARRACCLQPKKPGRSGSYRRRCCPAHTSGPGRHSNVEPLRKKNPRNWA